MTNQVPHFIKTKLNLLEQIKAGKLYSTAFESHKTIEAKLTLLQDLTQAKKESKQ